jgi:hypothetical protein
VIGLKTEYPPVHAGRLLRFTARNYLGGMRNGPQSPATVLRKETRGGQLPAGFSLIGSNVSSSDGSVALPMQNANDEARKIAKDVPAADPIDLGIRQRRGLVFVVSVFFMGPAPCSGAVRGGSGASRPAGFNKGRTFRP